MPVFCHFDLRDCTTICPLELFLKIIFLSFFLKVANVPVRNVSRINCQLIYISCHVILQLTYIVSNDL